MKNATFTLKRNQIFDMIRNLKKIVKIYDNPETPGRYIESVILIKSDFAVSIRLDRDNAEFASKQTKKVINK